MKKYLYIIPIFFAVILVLFTVTFKRKSTNNLDRVTLKDEKLTQNRSRKEPIVSMVNPASKHCEEKGGKLEMVTQKDGSQFSLCQFADYACEEWAYFRGECTIKEDTEKIRLALIAKGLNLKDMKVVIHKHLGSYISGGVVPVSAPAGGGYVFAVKDNGEVKVLADGNGAIMCSAFESYPDFSTYLVPECVDENGNLVER